MEEDRDERVLGWSWSRFFVACVFYDPPGTQLLEFAAYDNPPSDPAPIRTLREVVEQIVYAERRLWIKTIAEIERHHVDPASIEGSSLIAEVWNRNPHLENERRAAWEAVQHCRYIEVDENTTEADVRQAFRMLAATRDDKHKEPSRGGRNWRDPLTAVQCALLYCRHNERDPELQQHALARLQENKRYSGGKKGRDYLLRGLVWCDECGTTYVGSASGGTQTRRYPYYSCSRRKTHSDPRTKTLRCPHVGAEWIEGLVWSDVRSFLESPGEVLERVREQMGSDAATEELATRREELAQRLTAKQAEKDRYVRAYAQGHISEDELAVYAADLKNQVENLRLLITAVETDLAQKQQNRLAAKSTEAWLMTLRERLAEVEADTEEARRSRRELAGLLVKRITVGADEHGHTRVEIIYRFDPPSEVTPSASHGVSSTSASGPATPTRPTWAAAPSSPTSFTPPRP